MLSARWLMKMMKMMKAPLGSRYGLPGPGV
jgi:hypothetical protein